MRRARESDERQRYEEADFIRHHPLATAAYTLH